VLPENFLSDRSPLRGDDAVAAIITVEDGRYLMQLRDDIPRIFYPGHWGCFGGAVGPGEASADALARELGEELEMTMPAAAEFLRLDFDLTRLGQKRIFRIYYEVPLTAAEVNQLTLHEGVDMRLFSASELLAQPHVTPYDSFAVWLHTARNRLNQSA
jgi:8-oxo-dGTP pyrophosphatase MutT (NUDIX family)